MVSVLEIRFVPQVLNYLVLRISLKVTIGEHDITTFCSYFYVHNKLYFNLWTGSLFHYVKAETTDEPGFFCFLFSRWYAKAQYLVSQFSPFRGENGDQWWDWIRIFSYTSPSPIHTTKIYWEYPVTCSSKDLRSEASNTWKYPFLPHKTPRWVVKC